MKLNKFLFILPIMSAGSLSLHSNSSNVNTKEQSWNSSLNTTINTDNSNMKNKKYSLPYTQYIDQMKTIDYRSGSGTDRDPIELGYGYHRETGTVSSDSIFNKSGNNSKVEIIGMGSKFSSFSRSDVSSMFQSLGVSVDLKFGFQQLAASSALSFFHSTETKTGSFNATFQLYSLVSERFINDDADITSRAKSEIANKDWDIFNDDYADSFTYHVMGIREVMFNLNFTSSSYSVVDKIKASLGAKYNLLQLKTAIKSAEKESHNSCNLKMNYVTYPNTDQDDHILPDNDTLDMAGFSKYMSDAQTNSEKFINSYSQVNGAPSNAADWFVTGINNERDLKKYSSLRDLSIFVGNKYEKLIAEFPQLNMYFDEAIALNEDYMSVYNAQKLLAKDHFVDRGRDYWTEVNNLKRYSVNLNSLFNASSSSLKKLLEKHDPSKIIKHGDYFIKSVTSDIGVQVIDYVEQSQLTFDAPLARGEFEISDVEIHTIGMDITKDDNTGKPIVKANFSFRSKVEHDEIYKNNYIVFNSIDHNFYGDEITLMTPKSFSVSPSNDSGLKPFQFWIKSDNCLFVDDIGYNFQYKSLLLTTVLFSDSGSYDPIYEHGEGHPD